MAIKITKADSFFSKCIRLAADYQCQRCGAQHDASSKGLHCAHYHSRGIWSIRHDPLNAAAMCYGCHSYIDSHPAEKLQWFAQHLGNKNVEILLEKKQNSKSGRKREQKEITQHYKAEFERMMQLRADGYLGKMQLVGYQ